MDFFLQELQHDLFCVFCVVKKPVQSNSTTSVKGDAGEYVDVYEPPADANTSEDYWDEFEDTIYDKDDDEASVASGHIFSTPIPAVVLYDYTAASPDELSIFEYEEVEVMEKDGEGWCKVSSTKMFFHGLKLIYTCVLSLLCNQHL